MRRFLRPQLVPFLVAILIGWLAAMIVPLVAGAFWPIAVAPEIWHEHAIRFTTDPISPLPIAHGDWVVQPWLTALLLWGTYLAAGVAGLSLVGGLVAATACGFVYRAARTKAEPLLAMIASIVFVVVSFPPTLQTQLFATMFFAAIVWLLHSNRSWWWAVPIIVLWTNMHGSAVIALTACAAAVVGAWGATPVGLLAKWKWRIAWFASCSAAILVSPLHYHLFEYVNRVSNIPYIRKLTPIWRPLHLTEWRAIAIEVIVLSVLVAAVLIARCNKEGWKAWIIRAWKLSPLIAYAGLAMHAERHIAWFAVAMVPYLAEVLDRLRRRYKKSGDLNSGIVGATIALVFLIGFIALFPGSPPQKVFSTVAIPSEKLTKQIKKSDKVYVSAEWADYVYIRTGAQVMLDARLERYSDLQLGLYLEVEKSPNVGLGFVCGKRDYFQNSGPGPQPLFRDWEIFNVALVRHDADSSGVINPIRNHTEWKMKKDEHGSVFRISRCVDYYRGYK